MSDCGAIYNIQYEHNYTSNANATVAAAMKGGCDADCPGGNKPVSYPNDLASSVTSGDLPESLLDQSLVRLWTQAFRLGLIDDPTESRFASLNMSVIDTPATRRLNLEASIQSMVLLKNDAVNGAEPLLPIKPTASVALVGPHFNSTQPFLSNYSPGHWWVRSPLMAAKDILGSRLVGAAMGCTIEGTDTSGIAQATALAKQADVAVVLIGLTPDQDPKNAGTPPVTASRSGYEGEGHDRLNLTLQGVQLDLVLKVLEANPNTVVVLIHGGALAIEEVGNTLSTPLFSHRPDQAKCPSHS